MSDQSACPDCDAPLDHAASMTSNDQPSAGDASVCLYCRSINVFTGNGLDLRRPTPEELEKFLDDPDVRSAIAVTTLADKIRARLRK